MSMLWLWIESMC